MTETIKLTYPIKIDGTETHELSMRVPLLNDLLAVKKNDNKSELEIEMLLISNLCKVAPDSIRAMPFRDYRKLEKALAKLMDDENPLD